VTFRERVAEESRQLLRIATGWLGLSPLEARRTSIFDLLTGLDGVLDRFDATVPGFASRHDDEAKGDPPTTEDGELDRETIADKLRQFGAMFARKAGP